MCEGEPDDTELMRTLVYAWILSWVLVAIPAIFTLPAWAILFSIVLLGAFFAFPWAFWLILAWADRLPELEERVERRVQEKWAARSSR